MILRDVIISLKVMAFPHYSQEEGMDTGRHPGNDSVDKDLEYTYSTTISLVQMKYQTDFFVAIKNTNHFGWYR